MRLEPEEVKAPQTYWCISHQRLAMDAYRCWPGQGGILLPCSVVNLTEMVEIDES